MGALNQSPVAGEGDSNSRLSKAECQAELAIQLAIITSSKDNQPTQQTWPLSRLAQALFEPEIRQSKGGRGWIPATFGGSPNAKGGLRHNANVLCINALVLDIDKPPYTLEELAARLAGYTYLCHTTHSHTPQNPRWRVILPLAYPQHPAT